MKGIANQSYAVWAHPHRIVLIQEPCNEEKGVATLGYALQRRATRSKATRKGFSPFPGRLIQRQRMSLQGNAPHFMAAKSNAVWASPHTRLILRAHGSGSQQRAGPSFAVPSKEQPCKAMRYGVTHIGSFYRTGTNRSQLVCNDRQGSAFQSNAIWGFSISDRFDPSASDRSVMHIYVTHGTAQQSNAISRKVYQVALTTRPGTSVVLLKEFLKWQYRKHTLKSKASTTCCKTIRRPLTLSTSSTRR